MIVVIGGGVIGLSLAFRLLSAGQGVMIVERDNIGRGASWAAPYLLTSQPAYSP